jgi:hypothetical protein
MLDGASHQENIAVTQLSAAATSTRDQARVGGKKAGLSGRRATAGEYLERTVYHRAKRSLEVTYAAIGCPQQMTEEVRGVQA